MSHLRAGCSSETKRQEVPRLEDPHHDERSPMADIEPEVGSSCSADNILATGPSSTDTVALCKAGQPAGKGTLTATSVPVPGADCAAKLRIHGQRRNMGEGMQMDFQLARSGLQSRPAQVGRRGGAGEQCRRWYRWSAAQTSKGRQRGATSWSTMTVTHRYRSRRTGGSGAPFA